MKLVRKFRYRIIAGTHDAFILAATVTCDSLKIPLYFCGFEGDFFAFYLLMYEYLLSDFLAFPTVGSRLIFDGRQ